MIPGVSERRSGQDARTGLEKQARRAILEVQDVMEGEAVFGDPERSTDYFVNGTQVASLVGTHTMELRLGRRLISSMRAELKQDTRVDLRRSGGDWIRFTFSSKPDITLLAELLAV